MRTVARFVTRMQGEGDGLFIGSLYKGAENAFKPNTVYEIREVMGEKQIVEVGQGIGAGPNNCVSDMMSEGKTPFHWGQHIGDIIAWHGSTMFMTYEEYMEHCRQQWEKYNGEHE